MYIHFQKKQKHVVTASLGIGTYNNGTYFGLSVVYFNLIEIIFPKTFSAISPEGSQCKKKMGLFFRQQQIYLTTKAYLKKLTTP